LTKEKVSGQVALCAAMPQLHEPGKKRNVPCLAGNSIIFVVVHGETRRVKDQVEIRHNCKIVKERAAWAIMPATRTIPGKGGKDIAAVGTYLSCCRYSRRGGDVS